MSFGRAVADSSGFARPGSADRCPCGSGIAFGSCCGGILAGGRAPSPERLMRSRYTAFVVGDVRHLLATWHPGTRPSSVDLDPALRWTGLSIVDAPPVGAGDRRAVVEFRADWRDRTGRGSLHERSRFVMQSDAWWYLDGDVSPA